jgi:beta-glucan synthesis-associated protein KRE6
MSFRGGFNLGGINASGQVPELLGSRGLIDVDTPSDAYTFKSPHDGAEMQLIFSDEFNKDGRSFYPGDDPYWEAVDVRAFTLFSPGSQVYGFWLADSLLGY